MTIHHLIWQAYLQILTALPETLAARLTYDHGTLEICTPLEFFALSYRWNLDGLHAATVYIPPDLSSPLHLNPYDEFSSKNS